MDTEIVRVKIELDLINGEHFNPTNKELSHDQLIKEATRSFRDWLDTWCNEDDQTVLDDYIQAKVIE